MHLAMTMPSTMVESPGSVSTISAAARAASVANERQTDRERERESE